MNDPQRLSQLLETIKSFEGIDEATRQRVVAALQGVSQKSGYDERGRLKVAFFDSKSYEIAAFDAQNRGRYALHYIPAALDWDTAGAAGDCTVVCIFVNDTCDARVVEALSSQGVRLLALRCAGFNNVDIRACHERGISVVRVPAYSPYAVAEHTVGLMLMLNRKLHLAYGRIRAGHFGLDGLTGFDMRGKTVGIVGTGKIGRVVAEILSGFGSQILAYDPHPDPQLATRDTVEYVALDQLLSRSRIITLHVPLFPETHHMIDGAAIRQMQDGVMLINTSRGGLVDTPALINGLKSGKIGAAGLDVYEEEVGIFFRDLSDRVLTDDVLARLLTFNNVVITSHQAFLTHEALTNIAETTLSSFEEFERGRPAAEMTHAVLP